MGRDGCIYCIPSDADHVLKARRPRLEQNHPRGGFLGPRLLLIAPLTQVDPATHSVEEFGASLASLAEGQSRGQNKRARAALAAHALSPSLSPSRRAGGAHAFSLIARRWQNGFLGCDGKIYAIPLKAESVLRVDPITRAVDTIGGPLLGLHQWEGGVLGRDGALYCMPLRSDQVLVIAPPKTSEFFCGLAMTSQIGSE